MPCWIRPWTHLFQHPLFSSSKLLDAHRSWGWIPFLPCFLQLVFPDELALQVQPIKYSSSMTRTGDEPLFLSLLSYKPIHVLLWWEKPALSFWQQCRDLQEGYYYHIYLYKIVYIAFKLIQKLIYINTKKDWFSLLVKVI